MENLDNLSPEMKADLDAYYDWLEAATGPQEMPEDWNMNQLPVADDD